MYIISFLVYLFNPTNKLYINWISMSNIMYKTGSDTDQGVIHFSDNTHGWMSSMGEKVDTTANQANTSDTNDGFFNRPVRIAEFSWTVSTSLYEQFNPWELFLNNPRIVNRLAHFKNLKGNLNVKFLINGNPFYYGRAIATYQPLFKTDNCSVIRSNELADIVEASQRPHVYLDPTQSQGGEICCPFIWPKNTLNIPTAEWKDMGLITLTDLNLLRHANDVLAAITITVMAYMTDVDLSTPTSLVPSTIVPQSDEYTGVVSAPAHTLANWSGKLSNAPIIGRYARATQMISSTIAGVASLFGFSRPRRNPEGINATFGPDLATTNICDYSRSLALDAKKEVTIDPHVTGAGSEDEMALVPLACRESFLTTFGWNRFQSADTHLFSIRVSPMQAAFNEGEDELHMTPSCWVAAPFNAWTGTMKVRFQVVCSAYHRGRLRFVWDPDYYSTDGGEKFNTNYQTFCDISESCDMTLAIGWGQNTNYLPCFQPDQPGFQRFLEFPKYSTTAYNSSNPTCNGVLSVFVVNDLTTPNDTGGDDVSINVFTSMHDDFEVNLPDDRMLQATKPAVDLAPMDPSIDGVSLRVVQDPALILLPKLAGSGRPSQFPAYNSANPGQIISYVTSVQQFDYLVYSDIARTDFSPTMVLENLTASPNDVIVVIDGQSQTDTIAATIGAQVSLSWTNLALSPGWNRLASTFQSNQSLGTRIVSTTTLLPTDYEQIRLSPQFLEDRNPKWSRTFENLFWASTSQTTYNLLTSANAVYGDDIPFVIATRHANRLNQTDWSWAGNTTGTTDMMVQAANVSSGTNLVFAEPFQTGQAGGYNPSIYSAWCFVRTTSPQSLEIEPQAGEYAVESPDSMVNENAPETETIETYLGPKCVCGPSNQVYFGEQVSSWRQLLKRSFAYFYLNGSSENGPSSFTLPQYPMTESGGDLGLTSANNTLERVQVSTIYDWCSVAYLSARGSMRLKVLQGPFGANVVQIPSMYALRKPFQDGQGFSLVDERGNYDIPITFNGAAMSTTEASGALEVEVPWYNRYRFLPSRSSVLQKESRFIERDFVQVWLSHPTFMRCTVTYSAGEDFSLSNFLCTPILNFR